ncbi:ATP-binding protein [Siccirubricoccus deserti]
MRGLLLRTLGERIALHVEAEPGAGACLADRNQLESALLNLAINARDALAGASGNLTVSIRAERVAAAPEGLPSDGDFVRIAVRDDGPGMPEEVRRRAFEPFFTTKAPGKGTGLGLAQIHGFAHQSGGTVLIESAPGRGTEIAILLPGTASAGQRAEPPSSASAEPEAGFGETVLIVEDDALVRSALAETLRDLRYRVIEAADADAALAMLEYGIAADVVLSDVMMPGGMDGVEFATIARGRFPPCRWSSSRGKPVRSPGGPCRAEWPSCESRSPVAPSPSRSAAPSRKLVRWPAPDHPGLGLAGPGTGAAMLGPAHRPKVKADQLGTLRANRPMSRPAARTQCRRPGCRRRT